MCACVSYKNKLDKRMCGKDIVTYSIEVDIGLLACNQIVEKIALPPMEN